MLCRRSIDMHIRRKDMYEWCFLVRACYAYLFKQQFRAMTKEISKDSFDYQTNDIFFIQVHRTKTHILKQIQRDQSLLKTSERKLSPCSQSTAKQRYWKQSALHKKAVTVVSCDFLWILRRSRKRRQIDFGMHLHVWTMRLCLVVSQTSIQEESRPSSRKISGVSR